MRIINFSIIIFGFCILLFCDKKFQNLEAEESKLQEQKKSFPVTKLSGIWGLNDWERMYRFLGLSIKEGYNYCIFFDEKQGLAEVHFIKQIFQKKNIYILTIKEIKEQKKGLWRIGFTYHGKSRWAFVHEISPRDTFIHFDDSAPYREGAGIYAKRDGSRTSTSSINQCVQGRGDDYELDKANEGVEHEPP